MQAASRIVKGNVSHEEIVSPLRGSVGSVALPPRPAHRHARGKGTTVAFHVMAAGCGGMIHRGTTGPTHCEAQSTVAGLWWSAHGRIVWLAFIFPAQW